MVRAEAGALVAAPVPRVYAFVAEDCARNDRGWSRRGRAGRERHRALIATAIAPGERGFH